MVTEAEELQAKEFLKRAEIRTMRKDLLGLREADSLQERNKIAKIKTIEEQRAEEEEKFRKQQAAKTDKAGLVEVLQQNQVQERIAEKDLKNYATEQERQQIFLFESQRLGFEKQIDSIDKEKDPALRLDKNKLLLQKRDLQTKLNTIVEQEKKIDGEQKVVIEKAQTTTIPSERKGLEQRRSDLDKEIQDIEKKRWEVEKQIEETDNKVTQIDKSLEQFVVEKNGLRDKVSGIDKSLREIYSVVIARVEEKRRGEAAEQVATREAAASARAAENEKVQRQQWSAIKKPETSKTDEYLNKIPKPIKERLTQSFEAEKQQRANFLRDIGATANITNIKQSAEQQPVVPTPPPPPVPPHR